MKKISIVGVLIGGVVDIVSTNIFSFPLLMFVMFTQINFLGMSQEELTNALTQTIYGNWIIFTIQFMIGCFCSFLGGYIAALIAKHDELINGGLSSYLCIAIGIYSLFKGVDNAPWYLIIIGFILSPAMATLGGYLRLLQVKSKQRKMQQTPA